MRISVGGPKSEIEAEAKKKLITEKEIRFVLESPTSSQKDLRLIKTRIREILDFYDRIIASLSLTIKNVQSSQISQKFKQEKYIANQERDLTQAKNEKAKFRRFLGIINSKLGEN